MNKMKVSLVRCFDSVINLSNQCSSSNLRHTLKHSTGDISRDVSFALTDDEGIPLAVFLGTTTKELFNNEEYTLLIIHYVFIEPLYRVACCDYFLSVFDSILSTFSSKDKNNVRIAIEPSIEGAIVKDGCGFLVWELAKAARQYQKAPVLYSVVNTDKTHLHGYMLK